MTDMIFFRHRMMCDTIGDTARVVPHPYERQMSVFMRIRQFMLDAQEF